MTSQTFKSIFPLLLAITSAFAAGSAPIPRKSPEFTLYETSGKTTLLSSLKGKVVVMEFLFLKSEHCLRVAKTLNQLQGEMGNRGLQAVGVVFDPPNGPNAGGQYVTLMVDYFKLTYPVGYSSKADVDLYLGRAPNEVLNIPQVVVIDRNGVIRATSGGRGGNPKLEDENSLRSLIDGLLQEGKAGQSVKK